MKLALITSSAALAAVMLVACAQAPADDIYSLDPVVEQIPVDPDFVPSEPGEAPVAEDQPEMEPDC